MNIKLNNGWQVALLVLLCSAIAALGFYHIGRTYNEASNDEASMKVDTMWLEKHAFFRSPALADSILLGYIRVKDDGECDAPHRQREAGYAPADERTLSEAVPDTAREHGVLVPITQKVYRDSTYTVWVSGYCASLDSIRTYIRSPVVITQHQTIKEVNRWGLGLQGGLGITPKGIQPYIGVGLYFKIH